MATKLRSLSASVLPALLLLPSCADGGKTTIPPSEVAVSASHYALSFRTLPGFGAFPLSGSKVFAGRNTFLMADNGNYTITPLPSGTSTTDRYALARQGALSVYITGSGRDPSVVFNGAYDLVNQTSTSLFFTDRISAGNSTAIGLYYGTRILSGQAELAGDWHVLSLHTIFALQSATPNADNIGRGMHGAVTIATGQPGTLRAISGTGRESTSLRTPPQLPITLGGNITNQLDGNGQGDGKCFGALDYDTDSRTYDAVYGPGVLYAIDSDKTDGSAGMIMLVQKFDNPTTPADPTRMAGTFYVGGHTLFVNPSNSGADTFVGTLVLSAPVAAAGTFRLDAQSHNGVDFSYTGSYTVNTLTGQANAYDGGITLRTNGTNETWFAAISRDYNTLILVDDWLETRANNTPELNLLVGTRQKP